MSDVRMTVPPPQPIETGLYSRCLLTDAAVHKETCQGREWNLMEVILSTYYK
jgi:hypothetical protein